MRNAIFTFILIILASVVFAEVPQLINYQGRLTDDAGEPLNATVSITFAIWDDSIGGLSGPVWSGASQSVQVTGGLFSCQIGPVPSSVFTLGTDRYLGISVDSDPEIIPRTAMLTVPYAFLASAVAGFHSGPNNVDSGLYAFVAGDSNTAVGKYASIGGGFGNTVRILDSTIDLDFDTTDADDEKLFDFGLEFSRGSCYPSGLCDVCRQLWVTNGNIPGGTFNFSAMGCFVGAGSNNHANQNFSTIAGGGANNIDDQYSFIGGGYCNHIFASLVGTNPYKGQTISGGLYNCTDAFATVIGGGAYNSIENTSHYSTISGGGFNNICQTNMRSVIAGGTGNTIHNFSHTSVISGGHSNDIYTRKSTISGGWQNLIDLGMYSTIGGGVYNKARAGYVTISGGGRSDPADNSTGNHVYDGWGTIGGGGNNRAGTYNSISDDIYATIGGGENNTASGQHSTIPGGYMNIADGDYSMAAGKQAEANDNGSFVWNDGSAGVWNSTGINQFLIHADGGVGIGEDDPEAYVHIDCPTVARIPLRVIGKDQTFLERTSPTMTNLLSLYNPDYTDGNGVSLNFRSDVDANLKSQGFASMQVDYTSHFPMSADISFFTRDQSNWGQRVIIKSYGNVGIGVPLPTECLDLSDKIRIRGGGPAINHVLTCVDGVGTGEWASLGSLTADDDWDRDPLVATEVLFTHGPWGVARNGNLLLGPDRNTQINLGVSSTTNQAFATISGGESNNIEQEWGTIGGGSNNRVLAFISGGEGGTIGGGMENEVNDSTGTIAGGRYNIINGSHSFIGGGHTNLANGYAASIPGGRENTVNGILSGILSGWNNTVNSDYAFIGGGQNNIVKGDHSFAGGNNAQALHDGSFVWADATGDPLMSTAPNQFVIRSSGGTKIYTSSDQKSGISLPAGASAWSVGSDRNLKENMEPINGQDILKKIESLPIMEWNYKSQSEDIRHIGPVAQDFSAAFGVGEDNKHISTVDADGVALGAIQALIGEIKELKQRLAELEAEKN